MSKACVFPMTVSCNEVIFGNCFFHIYWALFIDSSVNICLFKIVAFSSGENKRLLLLFENLLPTTLLSPVQTSSVWSQSGTSSWVIFSCPPMRYHKWHRLSEATVQFSNFLFFLSLPQRQLLRLVFAFPLKLQLYQIMLISFLSVSARVEISSPGFW